jgi:hypothetical protein
MKTEAASMRLVSYWVIVGVCKRGIPEGVNDHLSMVEAAGNLVFE